MWVPSQKLHTSFGCAKRPGARHQGGTQPGSPPPFTSSPPPAVLAAVAPLRELAVPAPLRELHRGVAVLVYGGGAGVGLQQHIRDPRSAVPRGDVERGPTVLVDCVDVCVGLKQLRYHCVVVSVVRAAQWRAVQPVDWSTAATSA